jgi:hypothetical protein
MWTLGYWGDCNSPDKRLYKLRKRQYVHFSSIFLELLNASNSGVRLRVQPHSGVSDFIVHIYLHQ